MENLIIIGTGINGRNALEFIRMYNLYNVLGFAVNTKYYSSNDFCGVPVYKLEELSQTIKEPFKVFVSLFWNRLNADRRRLFEYCKTQNFQFANLISPRASINHSAKLGVNCLVHDFVSILDNSTIGDNVFMMPYSLIGSCSNISNHSFIGVRTIIGGKSIIGQQSFTGFNSVILDDTKIGEKCIIGASTIIKRNLPSYSRCVSTVDNQIIKEYSPEEIESKLMALKNVR